MGKRLDQTTCENSSTKTRANVLVLINACHCSYQARIFTLKRLLKRVCGRYVAISFDKSVLSAPVDLGCVGPGDLPKSIDESPK